MFEQAFKNIDDVLWKDAGSTSELDYTEQERMIGVLDKLNEETQQIESLCHNRLKTLDELKESLLHQAFTGNL